MAQLVRKLKRALCNYDPSFCDMYEDGHARAAAQEYLGHIQRWLHERFGQQKLSILDAGCQAGRLLIPLAQDGHRLIGIDTSGFALRRTKQHVRDARLPVQLHRGSIAKLRRWIAPESLDAVVCTEVLYLCPDHDALLALLADSVKPGGLLCISHRPVQFYAAIALKQGRLDQARSVMERSEGPSPSGAYHNWQSQEQLVRLYRDHGLALLACEPVDHIVVSVNGASMNEAAQRLLQPFRQAEATFRIPSYWLVIAEKRS